MPDAPSIITLATAQALDGSEHLKLSQSGNFRVAPLSALRAMVSAQLVLPTSDPGISGALWNNAGTVSISGGGGGGDVDLVLADFKNGIYQVNGVDVVVTDMFQDDNNDGDSFVVGDIQPGVGYVGPVSGDSGASLAGAALAVALPSATIILEFTTDGSGTNSFKTIVYNEPGLALPFYVFGMNSSTELSVTNGDTSDTDVADIPTASDAGNHKVAFTYASDRLSLSYDGSNVLNVSPTNWGAQERVTPYFYHHWTLTKMRVIAAVADVDLPALSA